MAMPALSHSPADIIRWVIIGLGLGTDPDDGGEWPVFVSNEPALPDSSITVFNTTPIDGGREMVEGERSMHWGIQVRVRAATDPEAFARAEAIRKAFDEQVGAYGLNLAEPSGVGTATVNYCVQAVTNTGLMILGKEVAATKRWVYVVNAKTFIYANG